jgi:hypothetical protein
MTSARSESMTIETTFLPLQEETIPPRFDMERVRDGEALLYEERALVRWFRLCLVETFPVVLLVDVPVVVLAAAREDERDIAETGLDSSRGRNGGVKEPFSSASSFISSLLRRFFIIGVTVCFLSVFPVDCVETIGTYL